jgi:hypothetical protein
LVLAFRSRRWREALSWSAGFTVYAIFYAWHIAQVKPLILTSDHAHAGSWLQLGGAAFLISLTQMNAFLLLLPQWVSAIVLPLAMLGFAASRDGINDDLGTADTRGKRSAGKSERRKEESPATRAGLTASAYVVVFAFVGYSFNQYWGSLIAPLFCFGVAQCPGRYTIFLCAAVSSRTSVKPVPAVAGQ